MKKNLVGSVDNYENIQKFQIAFLKKHGLLPHHTLLDIGCGILRGGIPIIKYINTGNYYGFDCRESVINEAHFEIERNKLSSKNPKIILDAGFEKTYKEKFNYILAYSVLIHMEDHILEGCLDFVSMNIHTDGKFYANVNLGEYEKITKWQEFPVMQRPIDWYSKIALKYKLKIIETYSMVNLCKETNIDLNLSAKAKENMRMLLFQPLVT